MSRVIVGARPTLPEFLNNWGWLTDPVPAERLAALRIGTGLVLLLDVLLTYFPFRYDFFGPGSLAEPGVFDEFVARPYWGWSLIHWFPSVFTPDVICWLWAGAALALTLGVFPRIAAVIAWAMAVSVNYTNAYLHNSGDLIRQHLLLFLMLTPCGACWSLMRPTGVPREAKTAVYPWALRLLFLELVVIYFFNGVYKVTMGMHWRDGAVMHYVLHTPGWARWSPPFDLPLWSTAGLTYFVLAWELTFPLMVMIKPARFWALIIGAGFHLGTYFNLEIGPFGLYALVCYLPLLPWEGRAAATRAASGQLSIPESMECVPA
jgi:Vitamin K-dependent gamma-carboxylase